MSDLHSVHATRARNVLCVSAGTGALLGIGWILALLKVVPFKAMSPSTLKGVRWTLGLGASLLGTTACGAKLAERYFRRHQLSPAQVALGDAWSSGCERRRSTALHEAVHLVNHEALRLSLNEPGVNLNAQNRDGDTALHVAVDRNNLHALQALLDAGASPAIRNARGNTPLHLACGLNNAQAIHSLIAKEAPLEAQDEEGNTPFLICAQVCFQEGLQLLEGANKQAHNQHKQTALHLAAVDSLYCTLEPARRNETVRLLLHLGVDVNAQDADGNSVLDLLATSDDRFESLETVLEAAPDLSLHKSALLRASPRAFDRLLQAGADPKAIDPQGRTLLHICSADQVNALLAKGLDVNAVDNERRTPLHTSRHEKLRKLIEHGANVHVRDVKQRTPLHEAAEKGSLEKIRALINQGADVNARDGQGNTPLHHAAPQRSLRCAELLVANGADRSIRNQEGKRPFELLSNVVTAINGVKTPQGRMQDLLKVGVV